jgi:hypothetical protein
VAKEQAGYRSNDRIYTLPSSSDRRIQIPEYEEEDEVGGD